MKHQDYLNKYIGTFQREPWIQSWECVFNVKLYSKEVQGFTLGSFGGFAYSGWTGNTYDAKYWKRVKNTPKWVPKQWDHIFFGLGMWPYGHVAIVHTANVNDFTCIEQNRTGKVWDVKWDEISIGHYDYKNVLGWFTPLFPLAIGGGTESLVETISRPQETTIELPPNPHKLVTNYSQKVSGHCGFFAAFCCASYNSGNKYTDRMIANVAKRFCDPNYPIQFAFKEVGKEYNYKVEIVRGETAQKLLRDGYALGISIKAPTEMIIDGIYDGRIDGEYSFDASKPHSIAVRFIDGEYELMNSLGDMFKRGRHNQYRISKKQLDIIMNGDTYHLIYK